MIDMGPSSEHAIVLAFVEAEIDSPRYRDRYLQALQQIGNTREQLIDDPDLDDAGQNNARAFLLSSVRGYRRNNALFQRFPAHVVWHRYGVDLVELAEFRYAKFPTLLELSNNARLVREGAANYLAGIQQPSQGLEEMIRGIPAIIDGACAGHQYPDLIAVREVNSPIVLLEGHTRATAYVIAGAPQAVVVLIGTSARMHEWWLF